MQTKSGSPRPVSLWVAMVCAGITGLVVVGFGAASVASDHATFSWGIGLFLVLYGLFVCLGAWFAWRRNPLARGLIVAPALLHIAVAASLFTGEDPVQRIGAVIAIVFFVVTVVATVVPSTRLALDSGGR